MTGVQVAPGSDRHVLGPRTAPGDALVDAGAGGQVDHVVVEREAVSGLFSPEHLLREELILLFQDRQIFFGQRQRVAGLADDRFHGEFPEPEVRHCEDVVREVGIEMSEGAAHVVVLPAAGLHQFLEFRDDPLPAAVAGIVDAGAVVDLFASVEAQDHVRHLFVAVVDDVVVDEHAVRRDREAEVFPRLLLDGPAVIDGLFDDIPVHEGLAAEEVDFEVPPCPGMGHEEVHRLFGHFKAHERPVAVVLALAREAVFAVEVAGVGDVEAQGLDDVTAAFFELAGEGFIGVRGVELLVIFEVAYIADALEDLVLVDIFAFPVLLHHGGDDLLLRVVRVQRDDVVGDVVHRVDRPRTGIEYDVVPVQFILMKQSASLQFT